MRFFYIDYGRIRNPLSSKPPYLNQKMFRIKNILDSYEWYNENQNKCNHSQCYPFYFPFFKPAIDKNPKFHSDNGNKYKCQPPVNRRTISNSFLLIFHLKKFCLFFRIAFSKFLFLSYIKPIGRNIAISVIGKNKTPKFLSKIEVIIM